MITAILRTYITNDTFEDKDIELLDNYWERKILDENGEFIQYPENMIQPNQSIINPLQLKDKYWKNRWDHAMCRPGHVFRIDGLDKN